MPIKKRPIVEKTAGKVENYLDRLLTPKTEEHKESVLSSLLDASSVDNRFSTKNLRKRNTESQIKSQNTIVNIMDIPERVEDSIISEDQWNHMVDYFDEISPIDDITTDEMYSYRRRSSDEDEFQELFKKEKSMLNDVLSEVQKRSKAINKKIDSMTGKGAYGITKNYVDLIEASSTLDNTKLSIIKEMINVKKTAADLRLKDKRLNPEVEEDDRDSVADAFYKQIMGGGNKQFLQNTLGNYAALQQPIVGYASHNNDNPIDNNLMDNEYVDEIGFNISSPIPEQYMNYEKSPVEDDSDEPDKYGYIAHEHDNVSICVQRYENGSMNFIAVDENGNNVPDYELPSQDLIDSLDIKPMATFAYDKYHRKYKILDVESYSDLSDLDNDDYYDSINSDDKYDFG